MQQNHVHRPLLIRTEPRMNTPKIANATDLYRIVSFERAAAIITTRKFYFAHPSAWDDPYERVIKHERSQALFAQCWCRKAVSDALWRIYSPQGLGVRIGTTKQRLQRVLTAAKEQKQIGTFKIQDVDYLREKDLDVKLREIRDRLASSYTFANAAEALFKKRMAFEHEQETRVVIYKQAWLKDDPKKGRALDVDPFEVLTNIFIDPRASDEILNAYTYYLKEKLGFPGTVARSRLYEVPDELTVERET